MNPLYPFLLSLLFVPTLLTQPVAGQQAGAPNPLTLPPPVQLTAQQDHQRLMRRLGIDSLRRGPDGNPKSPRAANFDEARATPYTTLPDPLVTDDGKKVSSARQWWQKRRPEIVEHFDREVYGRAPANTPKVTWEVISTQTDTVGTFRAVTKKLVGRVDNAAYPHVSVNIDLTVTTPAGATAPVPVIMEFGFVFPSGFRPPIPPTPPGPSWKEQILAKGWGYAVLIPTSVQADKGDSLTQGIIGVVNKGQLRKPDDWGALRAWAWGTSRALDFLKYAGPLTPNDLPVDSHELVALCAPRPVFVGSGSLEVEGGWVDAKGMFLGAVHTGPVYRLLGKKDLGTTVFPPIETALVAGDVAFRQHRGGHTNGPNWPAFLSFAERYFNAQP